MQTLVSDDGRQEGKEVMMIMMDKNMMILTMMTTTMTMMTTTMKMILTVKMTRTNDAAGGPPDIAGAQAADRLDRHLQAQIIVRIMVVIVFIVRILVMVVINVLICLQSW